MEFALHMRNIRAYHPTDLSVFYVSIQMDTILIKIGMDYAVDQVVVGDAGLTLSKTMGGACPIPSIRIGRRDITFRQLPPVPEPSLPERPPAPDSTFKCAGKSFFPRPIPKGGKS